LVERLLCKQDVSGSSPLTSICYKLGVILTKNKQSCPRIETAKFGIDFSTY
jgi:hypothetical protein